MDKASEAILTLKPVSFRYKREIESNGSIMFGLIAEDVEKADPDLVTRNEKGEAETDPVRGASMGIHADDDGDGCAKGSNLRQGKIDKDDAALDDVHAEIGVDAGEDEASDKGQDQECENFHAVNFPPNGSSDWERLGTHCNDCFAYRLDKLHVEILPYRFASG